MSNQNLVATNKNLDAFKSILNDKTVKAQIQNSLKENAGAFQSSMIDLYSGDDYLQTCDPYEVAMECLKAASLKLPLTKTLGFAYVVPYKNKPTFTIGYKGLIQLAQRTGQYKTINADVVYEGELKGKDKLTGSFDLSGERTGNAIIGYFAHIELVTGFSKTFYMTKEECEAWGGKYSPSYNSKYSPWTTEFDTMAMKTCLRKLIGTYGNMSAEMQPYMQEETSVKVKKEVAEKANANFIDGDYTDLESDENIVIEMPPAKTDTSKLNTDKVSTDGGPIPPYMQ